MNSHLACFGLQSSTGDSSVMYQDSERNASPSSSPNPKGFKELFRRRRKLSGGGETLDGDDVDLDSGQVSLKSLKSKDDTSETREGSSQSYGNYMTISGTGAKYLRDLFNKKYRSSSRSTSSDAQTDGDPRQRKLSQNQIPPLFRFRSKKDSIRRGEVTDS